MALELVDAHGLLLDTGEVSCGLLLFKIFLKSHLLELGLALLGLLRGDPGALGEEVSVVSFFFELEFEFLQILVFLVILERQ